MRAPPPNPFLMRNERSNRHHDPKPPNSMFCDRCAAAEFATKVTNPTRRISRFIGTPPTAPLRSRHLQAALQRGSVGGSVAGPWRISRFIGTPPTAPLRSRQQNRVEEQLEGAVRLAP